MLFLFISYVHRKDTLGHGNNTPKCFASQFCIDAFEQQGILSLETYLTNLARGTRALGQATQLKAKTGHFNGWPAMEQSKDMYLLREANDPLATEKARLIAEKDQLSIQVSQLTAEKARLSIQISQLITENALKWQTLQTIQSLSSGLLAPQTGATAYSSKIG